MRVIRSPSELGSERARWCVAIGFFDGVHLGHQQIIRNAVNEARRHEGQAVVITFDRHPNTVVAPARVPPLIYSLSQKLRMMETLGPDLVWLIHFDEDFSRQSGEEFVRKLVRDFDQVRSVSVGANFVFGHKRSGNVELLKRLGEEKHFAVNGLAAVALDGRAVSSTRIRERIAAGELEAASQMLGRAYSLSGTVVRGDGLGHRLGFPTANVEVTGLALPPHGVYAIRALTQGKSWRAVLNLGVRPTLANPHPLLRVEAHLIGFQGDLYGQELELVFAQKLRDERKFGSLDELREQIERDVRAAQQSF